METEWSSDVSQQLDGDHSATDHNSTDSEDEESDESDFDWDDEDRSRSASGVDRGSSFGGLGLNSKILNPLEKVSLGRLASFSRQVLTTNSDYRSNLLPHMSRVQLFEGKSSDTLWRNTAHPTATDSVWSRAWKSDGT